MRRNGDMSEQIMQMRERVAELRAEFHELVARAKAGEMSHDEEIARLQPIITEMNTLTQEMVRWMRERIYGEPEENS